jgi:quercetin dioxygenase-like cupin family protein
MKNKIMPEEELDWNEGSVKGFFGKELIKLENGSLKIVKVAPLASYPEHAHPDKTEYAYVQEGNPDFQIGANQFSGKPGEFFIFPKNVNHSIQNRTSAECLLLIGSIKNQQL